jgi:hypothetical protein
MLSFALLVFGCDSVMPPDTPAPSSGVQVYIGSGPTARTIIPSFARYTVSFFGEDKDTVTKDVKTSSVVVDLGAGDWIAEAKAFLREDDTTPAASGIANITIRTGTFSTITIPLTMSGGVSRTGVGSFAYNISLPANISAARLTIGGATKDLLTAANGAVTALASGDYPVTLFFERRGNPVITQRAYVSSIAQIYDDVETAFTFTASDAAAARFSYTPGPGLYFDHGRRITDADPLETQDEWEAQNTYYVPGGQSVVIAPVTANLPVENVTWEWTVDTAAVEGAATGLLSRAFSAVRSLVKVRASWPDAAPEAITSATASVVVKTAPYSPRAKDGDSKAAAVRVIEFSPAPGQFVGKGNGYSNPSIQGLASLNEAEVRQIVQDYVDGKRGFNNSNVDGKVFSLGGWGGYYIMAFDHSVPNGDGDDLTIGSNFHVAGMTEPGIVWVSQDVNGDGIPNEIWYRLSGTNSGAQPLQRYGICYFKPNSRTSAFYLDTKGAAGTFTWWADGNNGYPYHITGSAGSWILFSGTLLPPYANYSGYVDSGTTAFDIAKAVDEAGNSINLSHIDFVKVQTGTNWDDGSGLGEHSSEAGIPVDLHF